MKAITLHQPWASLIAIGAKTIETRPSPPNGPMRPDGVRGYPGLPIERGERIAIHAAARPPRVDAFPPHGRMTSTLVIGRWTDDAVHADDCECVDPEDGAWSPGCWALNDFGPAILRDEGAHGWSLATHMPLGAIVATAIVTDACPIWAGRLLPRRGETWIAVLGGHRRDAYLRHRVPVGGIIEQPVTDQLPIGDFADGRWGWLLADVEPLANPLPVKGRQGVWALSFEDDFDLEVSRG